MDGKSTQLHSFLQTSIDQYTDILLLMESMTQTKMNFSVEELSITGKKIISKQEIATATDKQLLPLLSQSTTEMKGDEKVAKRTELLRQVMQLNTVITRKLVNIKSLMGSELQQVKKGRFAIKGYHQTETKHGKNINNTL